MTQFSITQNGKQLDTSKYSWDETTKTFSTSENNLVLDFNNVDYCTFYTGSNCTFKAGSDCTFYTGSNCTFDAGTDCTFNTGTDCTFDTGFSCTFYTGTDCTFDAGTDCTFKAGSDCTFKTGSNCTFDTGSNCTFYTGSESVVIRRDVFEVILLEENKPIKLNKHLTKGFTYIEEENKETIQIGGDTYEVTDELKQALKGLKKILK